MEKKMKKIGFMLLALVMLQVSFVSCVYNCRDEYVESYQQKTELKAFDNLVDPALLYYPVYACFTSLHDEGTYRLCGGLLVVINTESGKVFDFCFVKGNLGILSPNWIPSVKAADGSSYNFVIGENSSSAFILNSKNPNNRRKIDLSNYYVAQVNGSPLSRIVLGDVKEKADGSFQHGAYTLDIKSGEIKKLATYDTQDENISLKPMIGQDGNVYYMEQIVSGESSEQRGVYKYDFGTAKSSLIYRVECRDSVYKYDYELNYVDGQKIYLIDSQDCKRAIIYDIADNKEMYVEVPFENSKFSHFYNVGDKTCVNLLKDNFDWRYIFEDEPLNYDECFGSYTNFARPMKPIVNGDVAIYADQPGYGFSLPCYDFDGKYLMGGGTYKLETIFSDFDLYGE